MNELLTRVTGFRVARHEQLPTPETDDGLNYYNEDALKTKRNLDHLRQPDFVRAYRRAISTCGWDYGIRWRTHTVLWAAEHALQIEGCFVELGTGRGWMMSAVCEFVEITSTTKRIYCVDRFLPNAVDRVTGEVIDAPNPAEDYYAKDLLSTREAFAEWSSHVEFVQGELPAALTSLPAGPIAFCHIDLNAAQPEVESLRLLWPSLSVGALVVLDDFVWRGHEAQNTAHQSLAAELGYSILSLPTGQGLIIKAGPG
jgi:hypothetical protein